MINLSQLINVANIDTTQKIKKQILQEFNDLLPQISALNPLVKAEIKNYRGGTGIFLAKVDTNGNLIKMKPKIPVFFITKEGTVELVDSQNQHYSVLNINDIEIILTKIISSVATKTIIQSLVI